MDKTKETIIVQYWGILGWTAKLHDKYFDRDSMDFKNVIRTNQCFFNKGNLIKILDSKHLDYVVAP